jgi:hypothetical protein
MKVWSFEKGWEEINPEVLNQEVKNAKEGKTQEQIWFEQYQKDTKEPSHNYTKEGWEGHKYRNTKNLALKEIAKMIKAEIQKEHPEITVSVTTKHFSGGRSLDVEITQAPFKLIKKKCIYPEMANLTEDKIPKYAWGFDYLPEAKKVLDDIKGICNQYNYDDSDGMIDYFDTSFYNDVTYSWELMHLEEKELGIA